MNQFPRMMSFLEDDATINALLDQLGQEDTIESMVEPIDDPATMVDFWDWADVVGIVDEFVPNDDPFWGVVN